MEIMANLSCLDRMIDALSRQMIDLKHIKNQVATREERNMDGWLVLVEDRERELADEIKKEFEILREEDYDVINLKTLDTLSQKVIENLKAVNLLRDEGNASLESNPVHSNKMKHKTFSREDLIKYTSNFSTKVGSGGFSNVFKGQLDDGKQVAVKVLMNTVLIYDFMAEMQTMVIASHPNLVTLYGFCFDFDMKALVYEFMENGSLDKILFNNHLSLEWGELYRIALETAKGLRYLHDGCGKHIFHRDIKPANVLIDENLSPKITDFGVAKILSKDANYYTLTRDRGTHGYIAQEFKDPLSQITNKCDVYSFGVMLFEILATRHNGKFGPNSWFPVQIWNKFEMGKLNEVIQSFGIAEVHKSKAKTLSMVAFWCCQYTVDLRPSMSTVVEVLEKEIAVNTPPYPFEHYRPLSDISMLRLQEVIHSEASPVIHESSVISNQTLAEVSDVFIDASDIACSSSKYFSALSFFSSSSDFYEFFSSEDSKTSSEIVELLTELAPDAFINTYLEEENKGEAENDSDDAQAISHISEQVFSDESKTSSEVQKLLSELTPDVFINAYKEEEKKGETEKDVDDKHAIPNFSEQVFSEESTTSSEPQKLLNKLATGHQQRFSCSDLIMLTSEFSERIGTNGFGVVYKGKFPDGVEVAIMVPFETSVTEETFMNVVMTTGVVYHPNIVKFHGYCFDVGIQALVYEYIENESLDTILYQNDLHLEWEQLYEIAIDTAKELSVFHTEGIIYHDIKASNILLNSNLYPKIRTSGLEGLLIMKRDGEATTTATPTVYSAPEMLMPTLEVTSECDVYSFGMLLFEILRRRSLINQCAQEWFPAQIWKMFDKGQLNQVIKDCKISKSGEKKAYNLCMVAFWCAQFDPQKRPSMSKVVQMLEMEIPVIYPPNPFAPVKYSNSSVRPRFYWEAIPFSELSFLEKRAIIEGRAYWLNDEEDSWEAHVSGNSKLGGGDWNKARELESVISNYEEKCPPGGDNSVVLYTRTAHWLGRFTDCNNVRSILKSHSIEFFERSVSADSDYSVELRKLLGRIEVPALFVHGRFIGGVNEVRSLKEKGKLKILFYGIPVQRQHLSSP